ncbi:hypothetical protein O181_061528 [Austropuccinia psidii MF-1]|uniref:Uncharacterized protein n=1 Tax=Austropuccinia psidii MF-1 TaxID=1389203 RepID=A0A9Q3HYM5_9BASI|nr:hypothetical protein [Austropuccinia psidii MF-1]
MVKALSHLKSGPQLPLRGVEKNKIMHQYKTADLYSAQSKVNTLRTLSCLLLANPDISPVHLRNLGFQRNQPKDRKSLSRTRRPGGGHLGHSGGWQEIEGNHTHSAIHIPIQQEPQTTGLEGYGSSSSAPQTAQRPFSMEHGQQEVQLSIPLGRTWSKFPGDMSQRDRIQRPYGNQKMLESHKKVYPPGGQGKQDKPESSHYPSYGRTADQDRAY